MSVRTDLETRLNQWALTRTPAITISWEDFPFDKPSDGSQFIQPIIIPARSRNTAVNGRNYREFGIFQISIWTPEGSGAAAAENLATELINLFPVFPKFADTSIEQVGSLSQPESYNGWRVVNLSFPYRRETKTI